MITFISAKLSVLCIRNSLIFGWLWFHLPNGKRLYLSTLNMEQSRNRDSDAPVFSFSDRRAFPLQVRESGRNLPRGMKAIWTVLFLACAIAAIGIAMLLVPSSLRDDRFWLSIGGVLFSLILGYVVIVLLPPIGSEQGQGVLRFQTTAGSTAYLVATLILAGLSVTEISFRWLAVLHIIALLMWIIIIGLGAIGSQAMKQADEASK